MGEGKKGEGVGDGEGRGGVSGMNRQYSQAENS